MEMTGNSPTAAGGAKRLLPLVALVLFAAVRTASGAHSLIVDAEGYACMGEDKARKQTEQYAVTDAKRKAAELASTYLKSETRTQNFALEKDIVAAYANAAVRTLQEVDKGWYKDAAMGDCYRVKIKAEVIPDAADLPPAQNKEALSDPSAPLAVQAWTDKKTYRKGETITVFIRGNKPFYARVLNRDPGGELIQLLPNPYRTDDFFNRADVYRIPAESDRFILEVTPPFGADQVIVYASTAPLGDIGLKPRGGVYEVTTTSGEAALRSRGIKITGKNGLPAAEFFEDTVSIMTIR